MKAANRWKQAGAAIAGALLLGTGTLVGVTPSGALGATLEETTDTSDDTDDTDDTSTTTTTEASSDDGDALDDTTETTDTVEESGDSLTGTVEDAADDPEGTLESLADDVTGDEGNDGDDGDDDENEGDGETEEPSATPDEEQPEESEGQPEEKGSEEEQTDEQPEEAEDEEDEAPAAERNVVVQLQRSRDLSGLFVSPRADRAMSDALTLPYVGYVDVPIGPRSTREIVDHLEAVGAGEEELVDVLTPFPVAGPARYSNDWGAPRYTPSIHAHEGTDLFAPRGTPVVASVDGVISNVGRDTAVGGNSVRLTAPDGTYFYYAHLDGFAPATQPGAFVDAGTVLGYVGDTGNALGTPPHLHYEIHPGGGQAAPPLPHLDRWLAEAREVARAYSGDDSRPVSGSESPELAASAVQGRAAPQPVPPVLPFEQAASSDDKSHAAATLGVLLVFAFAVLAVRRSQELVDAVSGVRLPSWLPGGIGGAGRGGGRGSGSGRRRAAGRGAAASEPAEGAGDAEHAGAGGDGPPRDVLEPILEQRRGTPKR